MKSKVEELVEWAAQQIRDYTNQQINIIVSGQMPEKPLTSEGTAKQILSHLAEALKEASNEDAG